MSDLADLTPNVATLTRREGFRLISTRRVALPVWRVDLHCRVLRTRHVSATVEFVLRAIGLGIGSADEVAKLLNLPQEVVDGVVSNLLADHHVAVGLGAGSTVLVLSKSGIELVKSLVEQKPVEQNEQFHVDGLSGDPVLVARSSLLTSARLDEWPHLILEPEAEVDLEFGPRDTDRFIAAMPRPTVRDADVLLSVIATESTARFYRSAAGLLFQSTSDPEDLYLRICIDGRVQEEAEASLRETGVLSSLGLQPRIAEDRRRIDRTLSSELTAFRADDQVTESLHEEFAQLGSSVTSDLTGAAAQESTSSSVDRATSRLAGMNVRRIRCADAAETLQLSLSRGRAEILISTSRFWQVDQQEHFLDLLRQLLLSGVSIKLEIPADARQMSKADHECLSRLKRDLGGEGLEVWDTKESHEANFVTVDGEIAYVFAGSPFTDLAMSAERFGDDRPTVVMGHEQVQHFLSVVHGGA